MRKKYIINSNILMCVVALLLCATLVSMHFVGGLYAKYTFHHETSDGARVASFNITQEGTIFETFNAEIEPGQTDLVKLVIKNDSEVAVDYTLKVTNETNNIPPLKFKLKSINGAPALSSESYSGGISTTSARQIPGKRTDEYYLSIEWETSADEKDLEYIGMVDYISVAVSVTQAD